MLSFESSLPRRGPARFASARILSCSAAVLLGGWASIASAADSTFADSLRPNAARAVGKPLAKSEVAEGGGKWTANKEVVLGENGITATGPSTAHLTFPVTAGRIHFEADVLPKGTGFVGLALGRGDLTNLFWQNIGVMLLVWNDGRYNLFVAGKERITTPEKGAVRPGETNHAELEVDTLARTATVRLNGKTVLENWALPPEARLDAISAAGIHFQEPVTAGQPLVSNVRVERTSLTAAGLKPLDYQASFVVPEQETTLRWQAADPGPKKEIPYTIQDYRGKRVADGVATKDEDGTFRVKRRFPRGYAEITFPEAGQTFGVVGLEAHAGPADPFFCLDAALTWLEQDPARREGLVRIMARSGVAMARERFDVPFGPTPGSLDWDRGGRKPGTMRSTYAANQLPILEILDSSKAKFGMVAGQVFPQNLATVATEWTEVARHYEKVWAGAEVYNESDLKNAPADQYVPLVKAFSYALAQAKSPVPLVSGVLATAPPGPYFDACAANGMFADADVLSFHAYDKPTDIAPMVGRFREWLRKSNVEAMPLWLTECGKPWVLGPGRPPVEQDAVSACEIAAMAVEARAAGILRYFPFVYVYYEEGAKNFGMMGREATPLRSMAAYTQVIDALSGRDFLGDLQGLGGSVKLARVFGAATSDERVAVLYTGTMDPQATVALPVPFRKIAGVDGRVLAAVDGKVPIPDGLVYVWLKAGDLGTSLASNAATANLYQLGKSPLQPKRLASPVILQLLPQDLPARTSARRYLVTHEIAAALPIQVRLHNLSSAPLEITPELTLPGGAAEKKEAVTVPAQGFVDVAWQLDATKALDLAQTRFITVTAKSSGEIQPSPLAIPVTMEGTLEQHLAAHRSKTPLPITDLAKWQSNAAAGKTAFSKTGDGSWRMDSTFTAHQGNWTFPRFTLPAAINPAVDTGFLIRARLMKAGHPAIIAKSVADGATKAVSFWVPDIFPADGEWHVVYIPFAEFKPGPGGVGNQNTRLDPAAWKQLEIGMSGTQENAFEISHLLVVGGSE